MRTIVYRPSRLTLFYAAYLLACLVQAWHPPGCRHVLPTFDWVRGALPVSGAAALLVWDVVQELRGRRLCFSCRSWALGAMAALLIVGLAGVLFAANCGALDAHRPLHGVVATELLHLTGSRSWHALGLLLKDVGLVGVALVLLLGRRPPSR
jgi:hypothetical protein